MPSTLSGRLLKADSVPQRATSISLAYADIESRCNEQLQTAQEQANQIILQAETEADQIRQEAHQIGLATGSLEAETDFEAIVEAEVQRRVGEQLGYLVPPLQSAATQLLQDREQILLDWETTLVRLSLTLAERIVRRHLQTNHSAPRELIAEALQLTAGARSISLKLNPIDVDDIQAHADDWRQLLSLPPGLQIVPDPQISRGGCLVETDAGEIDGQLETQLDRLAEELLRS